MSSNCAACGGQMPERAKYCPNCGVAVQSSVQEETPGIGGGQTREEAAYETSETSAPAVGSGGSVWLAVVGVAAIVIIVVLAIASMGPSVEPAVQDVMPELANAVQAPVDNASSGGADGGEASRDAAGQNAGGWVYDEHKDEVSGKPILSATITSTNQIPQGFPYGESGLSVSIRRHPRWGRDVYFTLGSGQLVCGISDDCYATVRFDGGPARRVHLTEPSDHSSDTLFASGSLASSILRAKRMVVELQVYEAGSPQFLFEVRGLDAKRAGL